MKEKTKYSLLTFLGILLAAAIPAMLILYGFQAKRYMDLSREIAKLEQKQEILIEENKKLVSDISILSSSTRIEKIAVEELGMHKAESADIVRVDMTGKKNED
ncbi:MAG: cell division protein FtsL [Treponema sp.]|nr:cell division protein FtsL [Treponema sp.]